MSQSRMTLTKKSPKELKKQARYEEQIVKDFFKLKTFKAAREMLDNKDSRLLELDDKTLKKLGLTRVHPVLPVLPNAERRVKKFFNLKSRSEAKKMIENSDPRLLALDVRTLEKLGLGKYDEPKSENESANS